MFSKVGLSNPEISFKKEENFKEKLPQNLEEYMKLAREKNNN